jgi:diazepam-binding inhibitor (GABA receptor modulator, acyl-CoA-binding protein)
MSDIEARFHAAAERVQTLSRRPDNRTLLQLYALFKQATVGDVSGSRPGLLDPAGRAKFDAWTERRGTPKETAMLEYVEVVERLEAAQQADR